MSAERWWIAAQGRAWGPYPDSRLPAFRDEGRLGPDSLIGRDEAGPFTPAAHTPELEGLFGGPEPETDGVAGGAASATPAPRPLLVLTDAPEPELSALEAALGAHGALVRIRPGLWLVRAREGAASLRNALSRRLRGTAMLLVVEAPLPAAAWFNLDGEADRALRRLWNG